MSLTFKRVDSLSSIFRQIALSSPQDGCSTGRSSGTAAPSTSSPARKVIDSTVPPKPWIRCFIEAASGNAQDKHSYHAYGKLVRAVAAGTAASARNDLPDHVPGHDEIADIAYKQCIIAGTLTLHADRGHGMRFKPVAALLIDLEISNMALMKAFAAHAQGFKGLVPKSPTVPRAAYINPPRRKDPGVAACWSLAAFAP